MSYRTLLLNVDYTGSDKYWSESSIKNKQVSMERGMDIHEFIAEVLLAEDFCTLSYKNKPRSNVMIDLKDGSTKEIGYVYRGKQEIYDRGANINGAIANFDVWVTIREVIDYNIEPID